MKLKKAVTILASCAMALSAVACGNDAAGTDSAAQSASGGKTDQSKSEESSAESSSDEETPEAGGEEESGESGGSEALGYDPNLDLEGYEYVIACFYGPGTWHPEEGESEMGDLLLQRYREIEEQNNCTISFIDCTKDEFIDGVTTAAASGTKYADQVHCDMDTYGRLTRAGYVMAMDELPYIDIGADKWNHYYYPVVTDAEGKIYGLDFLSWPNRKPFPDQCLFFNRTLIKELNLRDPYEMYDNGEWTWENFRSLLKDAMRDTDGDGETDIYGITCVGNLLEYAAMYSNGVHTYELEDGKYQFSMCNDAAYAALQYASDIRNVDKTFKSFDEDAHWRMPLDTFSEHGTVFFMRDVIYFQDVRGNDHEFGMLPFPKGPDNNGVYPTASWNYDTQVQCILKSGNDVDKAAYIFNRITEPFEGYETDNWEDYALRNHFMKDEKAFGVYKEMCENAYPDGFALYGDVNGLIHGAFNSTAALTQTPAEALNSIRDECQAYLDDNFNNK